MTLVMRGRDHHRCRDPPPEVLLIRGRAVVTDVDGIVAEYALAQQRYAGEEQGAANVAAVDHPGTKMARIAVRPSWVGVLDFRTSCPAVPLRTSSSGGADHDHLRPDQ